MSNSKATSKDRVTGAVKVGPVALYTYITIKQVDGEVFENHPCYRIFSNRTDAQLGIISWYWPWKEYVFSSIEGCVFNNTCLKDVLSFMAML